MKVVEPEYRNTIELKEITKNHLIACRIRDTWYLIVRAYGEDYNGVRLDNNTMLMSDVDTLEVKTLKRWYELSDDMHVFNTRTDLFKFMLD